MIHIDKLALFTKKGNNLYLIKIDQYRYLHIRGLSTDANLNQSEAKKENIFTSITM